MQKLINVVALFAGLVAGMNVAIAGYLYLNRDYIFSDVKSMATEEIKKTVTQALPDMLDAAMPEIPEVTPLPETTGGPIPF